MRLLSLFFIAFLVLPACSHAPKGTVPWDSLTLPPACQQDCASPYGTELGATPEGVRAFSNCRADCVFEKPGAAGGIYTGVEWQCVEFARRYLITQRKLTFPSIDFAADLWNQVNSFERTEGGAKVAVRNVPNGADAPPAKGDLLIYAREFKGTGHVAVVLSVNQKRKRLRVGEENYRNEPWPGAYARELSYARIDGKVWVLDPYLLGWKKLAE